MRPSLCLLGSSLLAAATACCGCGGGDLGDDEVPSNLTAKSFPAGPGMPPGVTFEEIKAKAIADQKAKIAAKKGSTNR